MLWTPFCALTIGCEPPSRRQLRHQRAAATAPAPTSARWFCDGSARRAVNRKGVVMPEVVSMVSIRIATGVPVGTISSSRQVATALAVRAGGPLDHRQHSLGRRHTRSRSILRRRSSIRQTFTVGEKLKQMRWVEDPRSGYFAVVVTMRHSWVAAPPSRGPPLEVWRPRRRATSPACFQ